MLVRLSGLNNSDNANDDTAKLFSELEHEEYDSMKGSNNYSYIRM